MDVWVDNKDVSETSIAVPGNSSVTVPITVISPFPKAKPKREA